jgi:hypothetical protein
MRECHCCLIAERPIQRHLLTSDTKKNERATGIEPALPAWKAGTLPLSYARIGH